jgi:hypothetical protein
MILREIVPTTLGIEGWVGFRSSMDVFEKRKISHPYCESYPPELPAKSLVSVLTWLSCLLLLIEIQCYVGAK